MEKHEARCLANPALKTCRTCAHDVKPERYSITNTIDGYSPEPGYCDIDARGEKNLILHCPLWEIDPTDPTPPEK